MKKTFYYVTVFVLTFLASQALSAQSGDDKSKDDERNDYIGNGIGEKIERFVSEIKREFSRDYGSDYDAFDPDTLPGRSRRHDVDLDMEDDGKTETHEGNFTVKEDVVIRSNLVVKGGDLTVFGKIDADVLVVGGSLYVKDGGRITGNARVINGTIVKEDGGIVDGYTDRTSSRTVGYREDRHRFSHPGNSFNVPWVSENANLDNFLFRYNRVEGLFLGLGTEKKFNWDGHKKFNAYGSVGWGIRSHTWRGNLGIARQFPLTIGDGDELFEIGVEGYSLTDSKDQWLIDVHENTAAAILIHEDYRDYFQRNGYSAHIAYLSQGDYFKTEFKAEYLADEYGSLRNNTEWSLFPPSWKPRWTPPRRASRRTCAPWPTWWPRCATKKSRSAKVAAPKPSRTSTRRGV